ncbi:hypothetical protein B0H10DRAFT_1412878 [Mycena sp. CBHHK59/15]|nr:hypothetical protein B0H10DRAFT_1412878 [Mycena sp. CBHHK59/15]
MRSLIRLSLAPAILSVVMSSAPSIRKNMTPSGYSSHHAQVVGAAYFMTNDPTANYLVSAAIGSDGKLALYEAVYTESVGAHGLPKPTAFDPLFSQGSVGVSASRNFVANVNGGSNTITVFSISPSNPAQLSMIGRPVSSGGEFPVSLAINKAGSRVCVLNGGKKNGISCYKFDDKKGLVALKNTIRSLKLNQTTPATGPSNTASQIIFSPDEKKLIVSVKGNSGPGFLAMWDIHPDGSLGTEFQRVSGGALPFSLSYIPGKNAIIASDPGTGYDIFDLETEFKNASVAATIPGQVSTCWSVLSRETGNFYMIDVGRSTFTEVHVSASLNSTIVKQYNLGYDGPIDSDVATIGKKDFIYSLAANATGLTVTAVNGPGKAQVYQKVDLAGPAKAVQLPLANTNIQGMATFIRQ